jgi:hypothetical protein
MTPDVQNAESEPSVALSRSSGWSKWILLAVAVLFYVAFSFVGGLVGMGKGHGFDGSLLVSPGAFSNTLATAMLIAAGVAAGTVVVGGVRPDAGLFAAAIGLLALSNRGGSLTAVLHDTAGARGTFLILAVELILLYVLLAVCWFVLFSLRQSGRLVHDAARDGLVDVDLPAGAGWSGAITHIAIMAVVVLLLAQSESKKQVVLAVGIGSFAGAFFPHWQHGARPSVWYWAAPLALGLFGYLFTWISPPGGLAFGRPGFGEGGGGFLIALARPLPLDYASVGTAGALLGYWMRRKSLHERDLMAAAIAAESAASPA